MKKQAIKLMGILLVSAAIVSCSKTDTSVAIDTTNNGTFKVFTQGNVTTVQNLLGDTIVGTSAMGQPVGTGKFTFFSLERGELVASSDSATNKWDIAFRGTTILTNNGTSGPGAGGGFVQVALFNDVASVSVDSTIKIDAAPVYAITSGSGKGWYTYNGATNLVTPIPGRVILVRTATGKFAKLEIQNYYKGGTTLDASASDADKTSKQRYFTFRYTYQANGSKTF